MRVDLKHICDLSKKDKTKYLIDNKKRIIKEKKSVPIYSDVCYVPASMTKNNVAVKENTLIENDMSKIRVKVVANTANWIDSDFDLLTPDCWQKSIDERKGFIPHLHDHVHRIEAKIGEVADIYSADISLSELGLDQTGNTQALIFITDVIKSYNEKVFNQYRIGRINQHSIGMHYIQLELAINDEDSEKEFDFWNKYYGQVINKDKADELNFFWVVNEIKLLENSAVLFGANELTPTLDNENKEIQSLNIEPLIKALENKTEPEKSTLDINILINNL